MRESIKDLAYIVFISTLLICIWRASAVAEWYVKKTIIEKTEEETVAEFFKESLEEFPMDWGKDE